MTIDELWDELLKHQGEIFISYKGLAYSYSIKGNEFFVNRKAKSITRSSIALALQNANEMNGIVTGPKKLGVFGASYIYPVFKKLHIIAP